MVVKNIKIPVKTTLGSSKNPFTQIEKFIARIEKEAKKIFQIELTKKLLDGGVHSQYASEVMSILLEMQSDYFSGAVGQEDPTRPFTSENAAAVIAEVSNNFRKAAASISENIDNLSIVLLSDDFLGIGKEGDKKGTAPIQWLAYFISGSLDTDIYWINQETYGLITGETKSLGRFGVGHLWHIVGDNKESLSKRLGKLGISLDSLKHPQSGKAGKDWFSKVWETLDFYEIVYAPALETTYLRIQELFLKENLD
jgi:hypothetical protein